MRKKIILMIGGLVFDVCVSICLYILTHTFVYVVVLNILGLLGVAGLWLANSTIKKTEWYKSLFVDYDHEIYPDNVWYRKHDERNFDVVNLGSSGSKWGFDFSDPNLQIRGMNWAQQPQTVIDDFKLLKNFHSILRQGGYVFITLMPFSSLVKETGLMDALKYVHTLDYNLLDNKYKKKALFYCKCPILMGKRTIKPLIKHILGVETKRSNPYAELDRNPMNNAQLEEDALKWVNGWMRQFAIKDFSAPLTEQNQQKRRIRIPLMQELIDFCVLRGYQPVFIIPPVTRHLSKYFTPAFNQTYIYDFIRDVNRNIKVYDYIADESLKEDDLYFNSFFFNRRGRRIFTQRVLTDIGLIK